MSTYSYESYKQQNEKGNFPKRERKVGYFFLPDNESSAIVRFDYSSTDEFQFADVHRIKTDNGYRNVACLRTPKDPLDKCPLCASGAQRSSKMFVRLIEYTTAEDGGVQINAKIWERPAYFSKTLETYLKEYGDLRDVVFKVVRKGAKGDMKVSYDIMYKNPMMYSEEAGFKKDFSAFDDFELNHHSFMERNADEMKYFLENGSFPPFNGNAKNEGEQRPQPAPVKDDVSTMTDFNMASSRGAVGTLRQPSEQQPQQPQRVYQPTGGSSGLVDDPTIARPRRTYDYK